MGYRELTGSVSLARLAILPDFSEYDSSAAAEQSVGGIFIGSSEKSNMPFFLNPTASVNPHIFIAGMSGSGKTYLTKNIMLKLYAVLGHQVVLLDFTGEYLEFSEFAGCVKHGLSDVGKTLRDREAVILYIGLAGMKATERLSAAQKLVGELTEIMRSRSQQQRMLFIILDEAWKLLLSDKSLATLVREGRKYGTGIVLASQLIEDMELGMLSNIATLFIFRMQNKTSLKKLELNYQISEPEVAKVQNLGVGGCLVIRLRKSGAREAFFLSRVMGLSVGSTVTIKRGASMVEIDYKRLEAIVSELSKGDPSGLLSRLRSDKTIELPRLISELILLGSDRLAILSKMRTLGIQDSDIADSFAIAIAEVRKDG